MRLMRGQPHERKPSVSVLSDNLRPKPGSMGGCAPDGRLTIDSRTANRFDAIHYTTNRRSRVMAVLACGRGVDEV